MHLLIIHTIFTYKFKDLKQRCHLEPLTKCLLSLSFLPFFKKYSVYLSLQFFLHFLSLKGSETLFQTQVQNLLLCIYRVYTMYVLCVHFYFSTSLICSFGNIHISKNMTIIIYYSLLKMTILNKNWNKCLQKDNGNIVAISYKFKC